MAKRGVKPDPTALKLLKGNPGKRPINKSEPKPDPSVPLCPAWLDAVAKQQWRKLAPELHRIGVLTRVDGNLLARYCQTWSRWQAAEQFVQKHGIAVPVKSKTGLVLGYRRIPHVDIANRLLEIMNRMEPELGMTPSGRTRLVVDSAAVKPSELMELLCGQDKKTHSA